MEKDSQKKRMVRDVLEEFFSDPQAKKWNLKKMEPKSEHIFREAGEYSYSF